MGQDEVSIIIISYNTKDLLRQCLLSLAAGMGGAPYETWVVDNASSDGSREMVEKEFPGINLIANAENLGFAKANNQALKLMKGSFALLLNSDAMLEPGAGKSLLDFLKSHPRAGMVGPVLLDAARRVRPSTYPLPGFWNEFSRASKLSALLPGRLKAGLLLGSFFDHKTALKAGRLTGACIMVPKAAMDEAGLLCEDFFFYGEVHDWCWTMIEKGREIWFYPGAAAIHLGGQSSKQKWDIVRASLVTLAAHDRMLKRHKALFLVKLMYASALAGDAAALAYRKLFNPRRDENETARLEAETSWYLNELFRIPLSPEK
ncbi:MAG: glycosyltransferase family 2 protein [Elusimicrobiota bacterium]|nr:glycosyltransferase family 2 protein [Elusimicrobiota bacterium]